MSRPRPKERIREEARAWVLRLKDVHSAADREAFQHWLAEDAAHQPAYDRALQAYETSGILRASEIGRGRDLTAAFPARNKLLGRGFAIASIALLLLVGIYGVGQFLPGLRPVVLESVMLSSGADARRFTLSDGSSVGLAPGSEVKIEFRGTERLAEVRKGRIRLSVARDERPFRIVAGATSTEANTGIYDASLEQR